MSKTVEIQRQFTPLLIKGRMFNAQYDGKVPPSNERDKQIGKVIFRGSCTKCRIPIVIVRIFRGSCMKCRIPIVIVKIFIIRGSCTKCRIPIVIVRIFIIIIIPLPP